MINTKYLIYLFTIVSFLVSVIGVVSLANFI
jgi:hypothetical protein